MHVSAHNQTFKRLLRRCVGALSDRIGRIRVLFLVTNEIGFANQAPLIEALRQDARFYVATHALNPAFDASALSQASLFERCRVGPRRARFIPWHYIITSDTLEFWPLWNAIGVSIEHGSCIGNGHLTPGREIWALHILTTSNIEIGFVPGQEHLQLLAERYPETRTAHHKAFFDYGVAKLAGLPALSAQRATILSQLELDSARKTILIASHWTPMALLRDMGAEMIDWVCSRQPTSNIVITAHPKLWTLKREDGFSGTDLIDQIKILQRRHPNLRFVPTGMPMPLLAAADVLICDHSSIRVEFALLDRPAALYRNPCFVYESKRTEALFRNASWVFDNLEALGTVLPQIDAQPSAKSAGNQALSRSFITDPSNTVKMIHATLAHAGRVSTPDSKRWQRVKDLERTCERNRASLIA